jgi:O-antigen/teichoic acid export membrane protein
MLAALTDKLRAFLKSGQDRTSNIKKNVVYLFLIRGLGIATGFVLVPLTIHYINELQYGIWLTIYSLVAWINTFDIGLSNGLRNKLAIAIAHDETDAAVGYISTTYLLLAVIAAATLGIFFIAGSYISWNELLKVPDSIDYSIWSLIAVTLSFLCGQFILQPINSVLTALHQPFKAALIAFGGQLLTLVLTVILIHYSAPNLFLLVVVIAGAPVVSLLLSSVYFFCTDLKAYCPRWSYIDLKSARSLLNLSGAFFLIQIGALVLYETDNIIITSTLGPADVTVFNIAFKYFSLLTIAFLIILTPYWSAFTEAYAKNDLEWMAASIAKLKKLWLVFSALAVVFCLGANVFYRLWIGGNITVPVLLSVTMAVYVMAQNWTVIYAYMLNGTGKLRIQLILVIGTGIINIPLSIILIKQIGIAGTTAANILVMVFMNFFMTYQCNLIIKNKATGIWNK